MHIQPAGTWGVDPTRFAMRVQPLMVAPSFAIPKASPVADLARRLLDLRQDLEGLREAAVTRRKSANATMTVSAPSWAVSDQPLQFIKGGSATTLETLGLVSSPTKLVGLVKSFSGATTSQATLDGSYDGSLGDQVELTFQVTKEGVVGADDTKVEVYDDQGTLVDQLQIDKDNPGEVFQLSFGLQISFTAGEFVEPDSFSLHLSTLDGVLDPNQVFQGSGLPGSGTHQTGFEQGSTATATLGGAYTGAYDDTLRFEVARDGIVGLDDIQIDVFDGSDQKIDTLKFDKELAPGTELSLSNGLTMSLSAGLLVEPDQFEVAVKADDRVVFGDGQQVQAGTLFINNTAIAVDALDTISTLAGKITASAAGVTASFDTATGEFLLTNKLEGPAAISLGSDDTGFFAAIGLDGNQQVAGEDGSLAGVTLLSELDGLTSGTFSINGEVVSIDVTKDSISDVIARINSLDGGVQASYVDDRLMLQSSDAFNLQNGTSAFFDAVQIDTGFYKANETTGGQSQQGLQDSYEVRRSLEALKRSLESVFDLGFGSKWVAQAGIIKQSILDSFDTEEADPYDLNTGLGLRFQLQNSTDLLHINSKGLDQALSAAPNDLLDFLSGPQDGESDPGLVDRLSTAVDQVLNQLVNQLDPFEEGGLLLDITG